MTSQSNDYIKVFERNSNFKERLINVKPKEIKAELRFRDGSRNIREFYWGSTFQSQSSRSISLPDQVVEVRFFDGMGKETRKINTSDLLISIR